MSMSVIVKLQQSKKESLDAIYAWSRDWQLSVSYAKCSLMFVGCLGSRPNDALANVHIGNHVVQGVGTVKDFRVHVDENLKFMTHSIRLLPKLSLQLILHINASFLKIQQH